MLALQKDKESYNRDKEELNRFGTQGNSIVKYFAKYGGRLPKKAAGGFSEDTGDTLYTNIENDPRIKAYGDSLALNSKSIQDMQDLESKGFKKLISKPANEANYSGDIKPTRDIIYTNGDATDFGKGYKRVVVPSYVTPTQPIVYRADKPVVNKTNGKIIDARTNKPYVSSEYYYGVDSEKPTEVPQQTKYSDKYVKNANGTWTYYDASRTAYVGKAPSKSTPTSNIIDETPKAGVKKPYATPVNPNELAAGGIVKPIASNVEVAKGATHDEGGIEYKGNEIEHDEAILNGEMVISKELGFAPKFEELGKKKGMLEQSLKKETSIYKRNGLTRDIQKIDKSLNDIVALQEQYKAINGINDDGSQKPQMAKYGGKLAAGGEMFDEQGNPIYMNGEDTELIYKGQKYNTPVTPVGLTTIPRSGYNHNIKENNTPLYDLNDNTVTRTPSNVDWSKLAQYATPFAENIYNNALIRKTPLIPDKRQITPETVRAARLNTVFNVDDELSRNTKVTNSIRRNLAANASSSQDMRKGSIEAGVVNMEATNKILGQKRNIENQLQNADEMNKQEVGAKNASNRQAVNQYNYGNRDTVDYLRMQREADIQRLKSANVSNAVDDIQQIQLEQNLRKRDIELANINALGKEASGVQEDLYFTEAYKTQMKDKKYAQSRYNTLTNKEQRARFKAKAKEQYGHDLQN